MQALEKAREQYDVYHIHINDGMNAFSSTWYELLGKEHVKRCHSSEVSETIVDIITSHLGEATAEAPVQANTEEQPFDMHPA
jgi:hypothetical protein